MLSLLSSQRSRRGNGRLQSLMITVWISLCFLGTSGQGSSPEVTARVGETVTLAAPVTANIVAISWYRGNTASGTERIVSYLTSTSLQAKGPQHTGREVALSDGSLQIVDVRTSDTGAYTGHLTRFDGSAPQETTQLLRVYGTETSPGTPATTSSGWQVAWVVALGVILGAAVIIAGVIVYYKRLLEKTHVQNDQITLENSDIIQTSETHYENTRQGNIGQPANETLGSDATYMELNYGDQATYEQLNRPRNYA
ncbi:carcinoembryonic antigen-related cell adhesion molecule 4-like isoform X2 [Ambystoma mexicanum]|uniref:carcinoembryonic antigen-related cell adhesion molecule 4-like isoform X2 n=1 Tax=Ambystoma mexicanum TaxID=8296 RepID=UPI0037E94AD7